MEQTSSYSDSEYIEETKNRTRRDWLISCILLIGIVAYIAVFWARLAELLPPPYNRWTFIYEPLIGEWWINNFFLDRSVYDRLDILWYIICFLSSLFIPAVFLTLLGRKLTDFGIGMLNTLGIRLTSIAIALSIPFGLWIQTSSPYRHELSGLYILSLLNKIPEHFLICGILTAFMLPLRRLPNPAYMAPIEGSKGKKALRWLGIAQPITRDSDNRVLAWFCLNWTSLFAIVVSGLAFFMIHIGRDNQVEMWLSLPGGITIAYITFRTHSIWHAIPAHWTLNLVPMGILYLWDKY
jgi:hypothetical protein